MGDANQKLDGEGSTSRNTQVEYDDYRKLSAASVEPKLDDINDVTGKYNQPYGDDCQSMQMLPPILLYDYPRVDGLGFLEFFLGNLKELQEHQKMSAIRSEIEALHLDIHCLVSSLKTFEEKLPRGELWTHIVRLAYQAEYVMDLYFVIPDSSCISTLPNIVKEVKEIKEKVLALPDESFHVKDVALTTSSPDHGIPSHVNNVLVGFQEEIDAIEKDLLTGESTLQVISLVGMGGAGKTSLAKHVFKKCSHDGYFDKKAWCTVSQTYQTKDLFLTILNQINPPDIGDIDDEELAVKLCQSLRRRRYLVIIDDVWDVSLWKRLGRYFPDDKTGSRILVTTRNSEVASKANSKIHPLRSLREDESWELLKNKLPQQESLPQYMKSIGKKVVKCCNGLPLSICTLGGLLHHAARDKEMWNQIAKDVTSTILSDPGGKCKSIIELSYNHLPDNLKSCFLYLGVFPEDHKISVTRLVRLWAAEGLVRGRISSDLCVEDVGKSYVDELIRRSLVIHIKDKTEGGVKSIELHDILHDFCLEKAKEEHFFSVLCRTGNFHSSHCPRRMSINNGMEDNLPSLSWNNVRTIISFGGASKVERILMSESMLLLNVLDILDLHELGASQCLRRYVHLRYLAIWTEFTDYSFFVESSFSKLLNLQVLILRFLFPGVKVPDSIWDLVKLRHIDICESALFPRRSKKIRESVVLLENLKSLSIVESNSRDEKWLRKLPKLEKLSCIFSGGRSPKLDFFNQLTSLKVENNLDRRCKLHLPASLRKLRLAYFDFDSDDLSKIGEALPNLEVLKLVNGYTERWSVKDEDFPNLKVLKVKSETFFREWDASEDSFPKLEQLWLNDCDLLEEIPHCFGDILNLRLISIRRCARSVQESAKEIQKRQADAQNVELKVLISRVNQSILVQVVIILRGWSASNKNMQRMLNIVCMHLKELVVFL